jgi:transcriptional regulator with XRE-family HTH domain
MDINQLTAEKVKEFRLKLNYSAAEVAKELGIDKANYSRLENGKTEITLKKLEILAMLFKVPVQALLTDKENKQNVSITHGEHAFINNGENINMIDPFLAQTMQDAIQTLQKIVNAVKK